MVYTDAYPSLNRVGYFNSTPIFLTVECIRHKSDYHFHNYTQVWYVISGTLNQNIGGKTHVQTPGSCAIILPYVRHSIDLTDSEDTPIVVSISFPDSSLAERGYDYFSYANTLARFEGKKIPELSYLPAKNKEATDRLVREMISEASNFPNFSGDRLCMLLAELLRAFCREQCDIPSSPLIEEQANAVTNAVTYMQEHANDNLTLDQLCSVAMMSRTAFSTKFKEITGMTTKQLHLALKIDNATELISFSDKSLNEISREVGLYDNARLTHAFKEVLNLPPSMVKKLLRSYKLEMRELSQMRQKRFGYTAMQDEKN